VIQLNDCKCAHIIIAIELTTSFHF
jgi:hypothetical protein